jgi:hypothetical protein
VRATPAAVQELSAGLKSLVDPVLVAPAVDRLVADPKVPGDVLHAAPRRHKIQNSLTKLWRITSSAHAVLPLL